MNPEAYAAKRLKGVEMSAIRLISDRARALRAQGHDVRVVLETRQGFPLRVERSGSKPPSGGRKWGKSSGFPHFRSQLVKEVSHARLL